MPDVICDEHKAGKRLELQHAHDKLRTLCSQRENLGNTPRFDQLDTEISLQEALVRELRNCLQ